MISTVFWQTDHPKVQWVVPFSGSQVDGYSGGSSSQYAYNDWPVKGPTVSQWRRHPIKVNEPVSKSALVRRPRSTCKCPFSLAGSYCDRSSPFRSRRKVLLIKWEIVLFATSQQVSWDVFVVILCWIRLPPLYCDKPVKIASRVNTHAADLGCYHSLFSDVENLIVTQW